MSPTGIRTDASCTLAPSVRVGIAENATRPPATIPPMASLAMAVREPGCQRPRRDYVIEKGSNKGFLHSHILIKIKHTTNVKLDYKKIKSKVCKDLGLKNIYMKNYVSKNNDQNILQYINKYVKKDD